MSKNRSVISGVVWGAIFLLVLAACAPRAKVNTTPVVSGTQAIPATGNGPSVKVVDQTYDGITVVVAEVDSQGPGWMAIHNQQEGHLGPVIGVAALKDGVNKDVAVKVDPKQASPVLYAMLHADAGVVGTYEFPGPDVPILVDGQMVAPSFKASIGETANKTSAIVVKDQDVVNGKVTVDQVISDGPGWLDIHVQKPDGTVGEDIGFTAVKDGTNTNVVVTIDASKMTPVMYAMLHIDAGDIGAYDDPTIDKPQVVNGQKVETPFKTSAQAASAGGTAVETPAANAAPTEMVMATPASGVTPLVKVSDQEIRDGKVKIDDVVSTGPGWIVVYSVDNGQPGQPIGQALVHEGDNPGVEVPVDAGKATETLYAQLHVDAGTAGTFEFPGPDAPLMVGVQMISGSFKNLAAAAAAQPTAVPAQGQTQSDIKVQDQSVQNGSVVVPEVDTPEPVWLVIHLQNKDGSMGEFIGFTKVPAGVSKDVPVKVDTNRVTPVLYAMLHRDLGINGRLEFPGADVPVEVNGQMLTPQFKITSEASAPNGDLQINVSTGAGIGHLVDGRGMSLYIFLRDTPAKSNCTGECLTVWRPLLATGAILPGSGVDPVKLGVILLPDGTRQVTYSGSPLYYYTKDSNPGDINGHGLGGLWFLVNP